MHKLSVSVVFNLNKLSLAVSEECIHMQNRALFLGWEGPFPPDPGCLYIYPVFTARFWIRADLINSFPLPFPSGRAPVAPGCSLLPALSPALAVPFPGLSLGTAVGQRLWNSQTANSCSPGAGCAPCVDPQSLTSHHDLLGFFFFFFNKEQIWVLIYKS